MAMIGKVRRMHHRENKSVREIVRATSLSRNTVKKWLKSTCEIETQNKQDEQRGSNSNAESNNPLFALGHEKASSHLLRRLVQV